jgi:hypothetical protein
LRERVEVGRVNIKKFESRFEHVAG